ncbi:MAG: MBL fold metallo-hydrolase [Ruminococcaceae bacterium]|nr:MBL fold metallo-hydrolase [Oscillospiraceae bacterium]
MKFRSFSLGDMAVNAYLLFDEESKGAALFDAPMEAEDVLGFLRENGLTLEYIFLTHAHFDHIWALDAVKSATGAKVVVHRLEEKYLNDSSLNLSYMPLPTVSADILLEDGDTIDFHGTEIRVIHTPGHTEGGVCYLFDVFLVCGDTLFKGAIGRFDFPGGDYKTEIRSIKEKLMVLPDSLNVYPGHGAATTIGDERKENPYLI